MLLNPITSLIHRTVMAASVVTLMTLGLQADEVDFSHDVVPILRTHCGECHLGENSRGEFSMNTRERLVAGGASGAVVEVGDSESSYLVELIASDDPDSRMPPEGPPLSESEVATIRSWIDAGAPWEPGFAFESIGYTPPLAPRKPELPAPLAGRTNPIDRIIDAYLADHDVAGIAPLGDAALARRAYLDLVGLLPQPGELEAFLQDSNPQKRADLIDVLLAKNTPYAEHWLSFWNDLLRNDYDGTGFITGGRKQISTWLYRSLVENKPYDVMVQQLLAPTEESAGFADGIRWRGTVSAGQTVEIQFAQNVGQAFLGINLKCASCHDSFIDSWTLEDAYGIAAIYSDHPLEIHRCDKPLGKMAEAKWLFPELGEIDPDAPRDHRLERLASLMTDARNGRFARTIVNRLWHRMMGRGIVHPLDAMQTEPWSADLLDFLASDFVEHGYDLKHTLALIAKSEAYQSRSEVRDTEAGEGNYQYAGPRAKRLSAEQFVDAVWQITGAAPATFDAPVERPTSEGPELMVRAALRKSDFLQRALGRPNRDQIVSMRPDQLSTLEAIDLNNAQQLSDMLDVGAKRIVEMHKGEPEAIVRWIYLAALSRAPNPTEQDVAVAALAGQDSLERAVADLLWAVLMQPEFMMVR